MHVFLVTRARFEAIGRLNTGTGLVLGGLGAVSTMHSNNFNGSNNNNNNNEYLQQYI